MSTRVNGMLLYFLLVLLHAQPLLASDELKREFLAVYDPGAQPLVHFYENIRIRYSETSRDLTSGKTRTCEKVYYARSPLFRLDTAELVGEHVKGDRGQVAVPSAHSFSVFKADGRGSFQLYHASTDYDAKLEVIRQFSPIPSFLYCKYHLPISETVRNPLLTITGFSYFTRDGERLARLDYERAYEAGPTQPGWVVFAPADCWAVRESRGGSTTKLVRRVHYQGKHQAVPLVKRVEFWFEDESGKRVGTESSLEVLDLVPGAVPEEEFTLAAFGLSDAGLQSAVPPWFYWQLVAIVGLVAAFVFWRLAKRQRTSTVETSQ